MVESFWGVYKGGPDDIVSVYFFPFLHDVGISIEVW
jgi:hypothetical protein